MITTIENPDRCNWDRYCDRTMIDLSDKFELCREIFEAVKVQGDRAVSEYIRRFDGAELLEFEVTEAEIAQAETELSEELKQAILKAKANITAFHRTQITPSIQCMNGEGITCWQESRPIERIGIYIPGGSAPLFSTVLMLAVPAQLAGCQEITLVTPSDNEGKIHPAILWSARCCGVRKIYKVGGIQAIAALTVGTAQIAPVYKLFGPGNSYVMAAKSYAQQCGVAIDMPAGPSEVMVVADDYAVAEFVAADMLSQAEHGPDSQAVLVTTSKHLIRRVNEELDKQITRLSRREELQSSLKGARMVWFPTLEQCIDFANYYAAEHLILSVNNARTVSSAINNAGSVFIGNYSPESAGDYASGTNHTLPTSGYARSYSGVNMDAFIKKITFQELSPIGLLSLSDTITTMACNESLDAHAAAVSIRTNTLTLNTNL